jgi:hypothetical protein
LATATGRRIRKPRGDEELTGIMVAFSGVRSEAGNLTSLLAEVDLIQR